jgi:hypothetical protein
LDTRTTRSFHSHPVMKWLDRDGMPWWMIDIDLFCSFSSNEQNVNFTKENRTIPHPPGFQNGHQSQRNKYRQTLQGGR